MRRAPLIACLGLAAAAGATATPGAATPAAVPVAPAATLGQLHAPAVHGPLILIGGGDKPIVALRKFVELAGGPAAPIVVVPTASEEPDAADYYLDLFKKDLGCTDVTALDLHTPEEAAQPEHVATARRARGIFFGGGDQARIVAAFAGSPVLAAMFEAYGRGAVVGGTSAGTACQTPLMITGNGDFTVIRAGAVEIVDGLGFLPGVLVDQHFVARQRCNRLLSALLEHPELLGVGIDEDTAIWVRPDDTFVVLGARSVMVLDPVGAAVRRQPRGDGSEGLGVHDLRLHVLLPGEGYDLRARRVLTPAPR